MLKGVLILVKDVGEKCMLAKKNLYIGEKLWRNHYVGDFLIVLNIINRIQHDVGNIRH